MFIADAQVHIWGADTPERPWPRQVPPHPSHKNLPSFGVDEILREMDACGVSRAVLVPPSWEGDRNDLVLEAARSHPGRFAVMGRLDTDRPDAVDLIATWRQQPGMLGFRLSFSKPHLWPVLTEQRLEWLWEKAEQTGVPIMVFLPLAMAHLIDRVAERHPGLHLVMDHLALTPGQQDDAAFRDFDKLLALAKRPNVAVKASALPASTNDSYPYRRVHPYLRRVYDEFGPKRIFWGTDITRLPCSYCQAVTMFTEEIGWFTPEDKEWIMGRGLCEWLGWKLPQDE